MSDAGGGAVHGPMAATGAPGGDGCDPALGLDAPAVGRVEWITIGLLIATYGVIALALFWLPHVSLALAVAVAAVAVAQFSSLQHEATHGHPTGSDLVNAALVFPGFAVLIPFLRFRDTHLAHHRDAALTDPHDDPESNYLDPEEWARLSPWSRTLLRINNTLAGRFAVGPAVGMLRFLRSEWQMARAGDAAVRRGWLWHLPALALALWIVMLSAMPLWAFGLAAYLAMSLIKIRTFLEHRAEEQVRCRSVIIEDGGPLALLFLNNNFHAVHHAHPQVPWYALPRLYRRNRERFLAMNGGYLYRSYGEIARAHLWRSKDDVPHPLRNRSE